jgi:hypothetical protein
VGLKPGQAEDSFDARAALFEAAPGKAVRDHVILQSADAIYAVRAADWKLVERENAPPVRPRKKKAAAKAKAAGKDELFDLAKDPGETTDVAAANPEVVARLRKLLADARERGQTR